MIDKKEVLKIDENGFYIEPVLVVIGSNNPIPEGCIETPCTDSFHKPRWNGTQWIEGLTQSEIDAIKNITLEPTLEERLASAEEMLTMLMGV